MAFNENRKTSFILITALYMVGLCLFSLKLGSHNHEAGVASQVFSNFLHIPAYAILAYLILHSFSAFSLKMYVISFIIAALFGVFNEFLQLLVPSRTASLADVILNGTGASFLFFTYFFHKCKQIPTH